jgi:hypothetical protein
VTIRLLVLLKSYNSLKASIVFRCLVLIYVRLHLVPGGSDYNVYFLYPIGRQLILCD